MLELVQSQLALHQRKTLTTCLRPRHAERGYCQAELDAKILPVRHKTLFRPCSNRTKRLEVSLGGKNFLKSQMAALVVANSIAQAVQSGH